MARRGERKGGARLDPSTAAWLDNAAKNLATRTKKQLYEAQRVRVRLDVPDWLKDRYTKLAEDHNTSVNQLGTFALAWWLLLHDREDWSLLEVFESSFEDSRSIKVDVDVSLERVIEFLTNPELALPEPEEELSTGTI